MKHLLFFIVVLFAACGQPSELMLYNYNLEICKKAFSCYPTSDYETFKSLIHPDIEHQSPMYGEGKVDYVNAVGHAEMYMELFTNLSFEDPIWLPGVDSETLSIDGSVCAYGTWKGEYVETGKSFSVDAYHYFTLQDGLIIQSGDYFDATGMVMAIRAPAEADAPAADSE